MKYILLILLTINVYAYEISERGVPIELDSPEIFAPINVRYNLRDDEKEFTDITHGY